MAAQLGDWSVFGMKPFEQAMFNKLGKGDHIRVEIVTHTPKRHFRRTTILEVTLKTYGKDNFFAETSDGVLKMFEWRQAMEFKKIPIETI